MILVAPSNNIAKTSSTTATDFSAEKLNDVTIIVLYSELGSAIMKCSGRYRYSKM